MERMGDSQVAYFVGCGVGDFNECDAVLPWRWAEEDDVVGVDYNGARGCLEDDECHSRS